LRNSPLIEIDSPSKSWVFELAIPCTFAILLGSPEEIGVMIYRSNAT